MSFCIKASEWQQSEPPLLHRMRRAQSITEKDLKTKYSFYLLLRCVPIPSIHTTNEHKLRGQKEKVRQEREEEERRGALTGKGKAKMKEKERIGKDQEKRGMRALP